MLADGVDAIAIDGGCSRPRVAAASAGFADFSFQLLPSSADRKHIADVVGVAHGDDFVPTTATPKQPPFQASRGPSAGQDWRSPLSGDCPSRFGPRN